MKKLKRKTNKTSYSQPLNRAILVIVAIFFVLLIVTLRVGVKRYKHSQILTVQDSMESLANNQKIQFEQYINNKICTLRALSTFPQIYEMDPEAQKELIYGHSQDFGFHHLFVANADGNVYYIEEDVVRNQEHELFFYQIMKEDVFITEPFYGADATTMTISVSIYNNDEKVGTICGAIELNEVQDMFRENKMFRNGTSFLINSDGYYVATEDMEKVYNKMTVYQEADTDTSLISHAFETKEDQLGTMLLLNKECQTYVTYIDNFNWAIVYCVKTEDIFKELIFIDFLQYFSYAIVAVLFICVIRITIYWKRGNTKMSTDSLTGCNSRLATQELVKKLNPRKDIDIAVIYLDLNHFKPINDTYGHDVGDQILCIFSDVLMEVFHEKGYVGRLGGDEFMVLLIDTPENEISKMCEKVNELLGERTKDMELSNEVSTSYGFVIREKGNTKDLKSFIDCADEYMYAHKDEQRKEEMKKENKYSE